MNIRRAVKGDLLQVLRLWLDMIRETYPENNPSLDKAFTGFLNLMDNPAYNMWVADDDGDIVGFVDGFVVDDPIIGKICGVGMHGYVKPEHRKSLTGIKLHTTFFEEEIKEHGLKAIKLNCIPSMVPYYEMLGFKQKEILMYKEI